MIMCRILSCTKLITANKIMCAEHWRRVPFSIKQRLLNSFQIGQTFGLRPMNDQWLAAVWDAIHMVEEDHVARRH